MPDSTLLSKCTKKTLLSVDESVKKLVDGVDTLGASAERLENKLQEKNHVVVKEGRKYLEGMSSEIQTAASRPSSPKHGM